MRTFIQKNMSLASLKNTKKPFVWYLAYVPQLLIVYGVYLAVHKPNIPQQQQLLVARKPNTKVRKRIRLSRLQILGTNRYSLRNNTSLNALITARGMCDA